MTEYALYIECGPQERKTMIHVLALLGCISKGPTLDSAMAATPAAIQKFRAFEARHSSQNPPDEPVALQIAERVSKGPWLGYGDPLSGFTPDFGVLSSEDLDIFIKRLRWMEEDILHLVEETSNEKRAAAPENGGRSIDAILVNLAEGQAFFLRNLLGKMEEISTRMRIIRRDPLARPAILKEIWEISNRRLAGMNADECSRRVQHGQVTWTACRALRRMLEHTWDSYNEMIEHQQNLIT